MTKNALSFGLAGLAGLLVLQMPLAAGGFLETPDITGLVSSPIPGQVIAKLVPIRWDARSIPVRYVVNNTQDPVPNPLGPAFLTIADVTPVFQASFDAWNNIRTSYIKMNIVGTVANPGLAGFDMKNELTFRTAATFGAIASSPSVSLVEDTTFVDGDDIDGDSDSDVSKAITTAADVDGDGDIEFPEGFYRAGTILDNDVQFNTGATSGLRFTIDPSQADTVTRSVDLMCVAVHEFGHSLGLSHVLDNQLSAVDGSGSTMFPFIDTGDPAAELAQRTLASDDIAWASYHYQEGSDHWGPAALQANDVAFDKVYGLITGEVRHGVLNQPVAGASVFAIDDRDQRIQASGFSGTAQASFDLATGRLFIINPAFNIIDGKYRIPVPKGDYAVGVEATDGFPVSVGSISLTAQLGSIFGQLNFSEEFYNAREAAVEVRPGQQKNVHVQAGKSRSGIDIVTTKNVNINNFGTRNAIGYTATTGIIYALRIPAAQVAGVAAALGGRVGFHAIEFDTFVSDASVVPVFSEAMLTTGSASGWLATVNLSEPLDSIEGFVGQDNDFAPFFFANGRRLGRQVLRGIAKGDITDLFLVLKVPRGPFPGVSGQAPLIGLDGGPANDAPLFGYSFVSTDDGVTFFQVPNFNFRFSLVLSELDPEE